MRALQRHNRYYGGYCDDGSDEGENKRKRKRRPAGSKRDRTRKRGKRANSSRDQIEGHGEVREGRVMDVEEIEEVVEEVEEEVVEEVVGAEVGDEEDPAQGLRSTAGGGGGELPSNDFGEVEVIVEDVATTDGEAVDIEEPPHSVHLSPGRPSSSSSSSSSSQGSTSPSTSPERAYRRKHGRNI